MGLPFPGITSTERATTMACMTFLWVKQAQHNFKLDTELTVKSYFGPDEVKLLIAGAMMDAACYDNSLQHTIAIILELETGIWPSSAFAVRDYRDCYIRFKNIKIFRSADSPGRFASELTIEWWKGYHDTSHLRIVYMFS
ncbi:uncharacterized protein LACBIDRAFT_308003 [Laccaria bicolor S238N-H82]|uniref:Predicted protein n=1 Tax=Laccaria bicolor (strain S238N-H82 / ATCC MYA-4686) TaxID=486041 RepID=B0DRE1_LACBS|nr:uncharacterized protein LACBIDRAFT_308003 [Laccaria bicolor S238N-H82]EDR02854.1 predicted protein [Laccaria bicolor S238N-H82]|eukprot:XP_001886564.1 predicted protein [Laccaria bicolor S238N-H82]